MSLSFLVIARIISSLLFVLLIIFSQTILCSSYSVQVSFVTRLTVCDIVPFRGYLRWGGAWTRLENGIPLRCGNCLKTPQNPQRQVHPIKMAGYHFSRKDMIHVLRALCWAFWILYYTAIARNLSDLQRVILLNSNCGFMT